MSQQQQHTYVAIMAGGVGSRFWPSSREDQPKQFLDMLGVGKSLLRLTFERFLALCPKEHIYIVTNKKYVAQVAEQLPELAPGQIVGEPSRNNTAPCIAYISHKIFALDPEANFVVAPSDHVIGDDAAFIADLEKALAFSAAQEALVTLGIQPSRPDTGYGYIRYAREAAEGGLHKVLQFTEKPNLETAQAFLASGDYVWNAGIFVWRAGSILAAFRQYAADVNAVFEQHIVPALNSAEEAATVDAHYPSCPNISIDFAIMEKADNIYTLPTDFGWSDLGTWASLYAFRAKDAAGNVLQGSHIIAEDTAGCMVKAIDGKLLVLKGLEDFIVVDEGDVLMICPRDQEQAVKALTQRVKAAYGEDFL